MRVAIASDVPERQEMAGEDIRTRGFIRPAPVRFALEQFDKLALGVRGQLGQLFAQQNIAVLLTHMEQRRGEILRCHTSMVSAYQESVALPEFISFDITIAIYVLCL